MTSQVFTIPVDFQDRLEEVDVKDTRSDEDILETLRHHAPIKSEKNVWAYWDSGIDNAAGFSKRNVCDWVRILGPQWTVRILDKVPGSPNHALKWIPEDMLPEAWIKDSFDGPWAGPHSADCLRGALLYLYGACYSDVGTIMLRHIDRIFWNKLEDPESQYEVAAMVAMGQVIANGFIGSRKGNRFIKLWHDLFIHLWRGGKTSVVGFKHDPVLQFLNTMPVPSADGPGWVWSIPLDDFFEYLAQSCCWARLCMLEDAGNGFKATEYWLNNVLCFSYQDEALPSESMLGYSNTGEKLYKLLSLPVVASEEEKATADYKKASELVWTMLSDYSIQKLGHGKDILNDVQLAVLWRENPGKDAEPGTFAHLLRYGSVHFRQKRNSIKYLEPEKPAMTVKRGLLDPPPPGEFI